MTPCESIIRQATAQTFPTWSVQLFFYGCNKVFHPDSLGSIHMITVNLQSESCSTLSSFYKKEITRRLIQSLSKLLRKTVFIPTTKNKPQAMQNNSFARNIILVDAQHLDHVAFDLIVNFERMLGRRIPQADLAHWLDCIALDGGLTPGENDVQVIFIHEQEKSSLTHFTPSHFDNDLNGKAFKDHLGEFTLASLPIEPIVSRDDLLVQSFESLLLDAQVERIMLIADLDGFTDESLHLAQRIKQLCATPPTPEQGEALPQKSITLFGMQPLAGRGFQSEILGYSLTSAMGVSGGEFQ